MHVKTYTGSSTSAVLASIKADLGSEAVILDTRETAKDGKAEIVITAAVERDMAGSVKGYAPADSARSFQAKYGSPEGGWKNWQEEWFSIKNHLLTLMKPELQLGRLSPRQRVAVEFLEKEGVDATSLLAVFEALLPDPQASILAPLDALARVRGWSADNWPQQVHCLVGPFGSGKTTALVRLALLLRKEKPEYTIWVVNADSHRGGGRLLLKNYAHLCGFKYYEVSNAVEFAAVLAGARRENVDRILVDLPGLPRGKSMPELLDYYGIMGAGNALHLVMTPHYADADLRVIAARYLPDALWQNASLIWTKLDETDRFGAVVNIGAASRLPVSALSCGPELNDTLAPAESAALWRLLFKKEMPCKGYSDGSGF